MAGCYLLRNTLFLRGCGARLCEKAVPFSGRVSNLGVCNTRSYAVIPNTQEYLKRKGVLEAVNTDIASATQSKLFAVVCLAGRQHKVTSNDTLVVNSLEAETGSQIFLNKVLLVGSEDFTLIGRPVVSSETVKITATVIEHTRLKKITVFKKKRRKNYKKTQGHRQDSTVLRINEINVTPNLD
ncbi:PREDICTED: uncharacterized protein LOC105313039 [Amphimedon queenslandica]|uniref:Large ribosomal subunit protein bL21m n=1 Tax=Amphimedon queenslandica TaxID=400682 RepID=A0A1X7UNZ0_AMPQE|nr:PREDICTED: uncharacterized protein LOC105313039 [Amphimedon queenslandica]|eukprot:XP_019853186.1 PREDICTED: uncharacterized protein LOC105313039 [Amphimedon queenslandica]